MEKHLSFLLAVEEYITNNPECGAYVSQFVAKGIEKARIEGMIAYQKHLIENLQMENVKLVAKLKTME